MAHATVAPPCPRIACISQRNVEPDPGYLTMPWNGTHHGSPGILFESNWSWNIWMSSASRPRIGTPCGAVGA
ncbi:hypothetical protein EYZ11_008602 [Aspergillus tanneri]|uniref:Uncharacterized protein n=1 Tax=Aspergillus tanneri TaxID=1220188 RepID=A0A4S3JC91_9EURO|nr:hypothetical protein EYZ11_008602 [Aspergillus tanneri]